MTTIGSTLTITGEMTSSEDVTVHGRVKGKLHMQSGALVVAPKGHVDAEVKGSRMTFQGTVAGDVTAAERIELAPTADVTGTLATPSLILQDGATFNGLIEMDRSKSKSGLKSVARAS